MRESDSNQPIINRLIAQQFIVQSPSFLLSFADSNISLSCKNNVKKKLLFGQTC